MNTPAPQTEYLLLFRNTQLENRLSTDEMTDAMRRLNEWLERWQTSGNLTGGQPLDNEARVLSGARRERVLADGPFAESKEAVGGYVLVRAADFDEAVQIAAEWPLLDYDASGEVRPVRKQCASMERLGMQLVELGA